MGIMNRRKMEISRRRALDGLCTVDHYRYEKEKTRKMVD